MTPQPQWMADLWNALKQRREDVYRRTRGQRGVYHSEDRAVLTFFDLTNEITTLRHECEEWRLVPAITAHRVAKHLTDAYDAFFRRHKAGEAPGYPRRQRRDRATTIPLGTMATTGWRIEQRDDNPLSWRLHYGSVTSMRDRSTWIHARGKMPARRLDTERRGAVCCDRPGDEPGGVDVHVLYWRNGDIIYRDGKWWLSVCVEMAPRREAGRFPTRIEFGLIDGFARVNGIGEEPPGLADLPLLQDELDALKSERDRQWPRGTRRSEEAETAYREASAEISGLSGMIARRRRNALHVWTARIVARSSDITIIAPKIARHVKSPRGDERHWGAQIEAVSALNRHVLAQAPATAIQMLRYKADEAGVRCDVVSDDAPKIAVGGDLVTAGKLSRQVRRKLRKEAA